MPNFFINHDSDIVFFAGANNLIPIEIALKIANKIYANERFSAYIIIPMWPEGNPTGAPTQRILYWQVRFFISLSASNLLYLLYFPLSVATSNGVIQFICLVLFIVEKNNANDV